MSLKFYTSWFCPYAQRAWITLEHHNIDYELIEAYDGNNKVPRLLELNPKGQVPTIEFLQSMIDGLPMLVKKDGLKTVNDAMVLTESMNCVEFLNSMAGKESTTDLIQNSRVGCN